MTSSSARSVHLMAAVAVSGCALVGAHQMRSTLVTAVAAVGAFASVLAVVWMWQGGARGRPLWARAGAVAVRTVVTLLALVGALGMLGGLEAAWGVVAVALWWVLRAERASGAHRASGARREDASVHGGASTGDVGDVTRHGGARGPARRLDPARRTDRARLRGIARRKAIARRKDRARYTDHATSDREPDRFEPSHVVDPGPDAAPPDAAPPDRLLRDAVAPDAVAPDAVAPDAVAPDAVAPDAVAPDAVAPDAVAPDAVAADAVASGGAAPPVGVRPDADEILLSFARTPFAQLWTTTMAGGGAADVAAVVHGFDAAAVRSAWAECRAFGATGAPSQADLATMRGALLDEFERRDPEAFAAWLAAGGTNDLPLRARGGS